MKLAWLPPQWLHCIAFQAVDLKDSRVLQADQKRNIGASMH